MTARFAIVLAAMCIAVSTAVSQTSYYSITDLGRLPDAFSTVPLAINNHGEVVGWCQGPQAFTRAFVWRPGQGISEMPMPAGCDYNVARDISDSGFVVGHAKTGILGAEHAWRWRDGALEDLGSLVPGGFSEAWGVNELGETVGRSQGSGFQGNAFCFSDAREMLDLQPGAAQAINSAGQVTGYTDNNQVFRWTPSGGREILGPLGSYALTFGYCTNESGQIGGEATGAAGDSGIAFIHAPGTGYISLPSAGRFNQVSGLNNRGEAVGFSGNTRGVSTTEWLWRADVGLVNLTTIVDPAAGYFITRVFDINDAGQVIVLASTATESGRALILTPPRVAGDVDDDGHVGLSDLSLLLSSYGLCGGDPGFNAGADFDQSGCVELIDLAFLLAHFGS